MNPNHLLSELGILAAFSISKKIREEEITKIRNSIKKKTTNPDKIDDLLYEKLSESVKKSVSKEVIPGLIFENEDSTLIVKDTEDKVEESNKKHITARDVEKEKDTLVRLTHFAAVIAKKMVDKKTNNYYSCFIINTIVNMLGLDEEDFEEFNIKFAQFKNDDYDCDDEDDDDDDDEDDDNYEDGYDDD